MVAQGYTGSTSTTRHRVRELKKELNQKKKFSFFISRHKIIRLIFNQKPESTLAAEHIVEIFNNYPLARELLTLLYQFQKILTDRQYERFVEWIHQVEQLSAPELKSFINGIKRDLESVFHACKYPYSDGVAEASLNQTKLIKRIMFGRNSFDTLRKRFYCENSANIQVVFRILTNTHVAIRSFIYTYNTLYIARTSIFLFVVVLWVTLLI
ncbi:transposase [Bacillus thuringiensis]|uniref:transposase n=1 Tax=Bacillus cereus group TaxID=86661 RepID=UPI0013FE14DB